MSTTRPKDHHKSDSRDTVNREPTAEHESTKLAKVKGFLSVPAQVVAAHLGLEPPKVDATLTSDQIATARQTLKTPVATPALDKLPAGLQHLERSKAGRVQRSLEQYQRNLGEMQQKIAERAIEKPVSHKVSKVLSLTARNRALLDVQHLISEHVEDERSYRHYKNPENIIKWVTESDITQMRRWKGPSMHSDEDNATPEE